MWLLTADVIVHHVYCWQVRDMWGFRMTARYEMYAKLLQDYSQPHFQPQVIRGSGQ